MPSDQTSALSSKLLPILAVVFVITLGMGMMIPVLPLLAVKLGGEAALSGALLASFGAARLVAGIPAGAASDRFGRRAMMLFGLGLFVVGSLTAAGAGSIASLAFALVVMGAGSACYVTAALAAVADLSSTGGRGRMMSFYQGGAQAGVVVGPVVGGLLVVRLGPSSPFILQAALAAAVGIAAALFLRETKQAGSASTALTAPFRERMMLIAAPRFMAVCALMFGAYFSRVAANWQVVPLLAHQDFGYGPEAVGVLLTVGAISNFAVLPVVARCIDGFGSKPTAIAGGILAIAGLLLLCLPAVEWRLWFSVILLGMAGSTLATAASAHAALVSRAQIGVTMGTLRMAGDIGLVLGPLALTFLLAHLDLSIRAGLALVSVLMTLIVMTFATVNASKGESR